MAADGDQRVNTAVAQVREKAIVVDDGLFHNLMDTTRFEHLQRVSKVFANSALVPEHFRGKEADCFIAVEMAMRLKLHPFNLMQSLYVVHGKPGIEAKMAIALINSSGIFEGPVQFKLEGENMTRQCTAFAVHAKTQQLCQTTVTMTMAKAEGWMDKSGSKWKTLPDLMLQYRSASFFSRLYCPEVIFGMQTTDELHDAHEIDVTPRAEPVTTAPAKPRLRAAMGVPPEHVVEEEVPPAETPVAAAPASTPVTAAATGPTSGNPPPKPFGAPREPQAAPETPPATEPLKSAGAPPEGAAVMSFEEVLKYAKRAKTKDQGDIVADQIRHASYTDEQRNEVRIILESKKFED